MSGEHSHDGGVGLALTWLTERHRKGWNNAFAALVEDWLPPNRAKGAGLDDDGMEMLEINAGDWLLARGEINARGGLNNINSYLLGPTGPQFTPGQRAWIAQLAEQPLRLYRVTEVRPGEGLTLVDELDAQTEAISVRDRSCSRSVKPGQLMGVRIMRADENSDPHFELSGSIYPIAKLHEARALQQVRRVLSGATALQLAGANVRDLAETTIARVWLSQWFAPAPMPQILDASTREPMLLVTDHYRVHNAEALATALAAQPDVNGDTQQGWHRDAASMDGALRSLVTINPGPSAGRLELFYRTQRLADEGRAWFDALAGQAVQFLMRETADPANAAGHDMIAEESSEEAADNPAGDSAASMPPEVMARVYEEFVHRHYAHWCDESIPALSGLTPRQAIASSAGLARVKGLLHLYESGEAEQSAEQGRPAVSYQFLWDALSLQR